MRMGTRMRAASAALAVLAGSLTFATVGAGTAHATTSCASVLGPIQSIKVGSQTIGQFYLAWNYCDSNNKVAYTEVNLWNTNYVNANWRSGQIDVRSSSDFKSAGGSPQPNAGTWWWDSPFTKVAPNVYNTRLYYGRWNFTAGGHSCSGETPTWNFSNGTPDTSGMYSSCS